MERRGLTLMILILIFAIEIIALNQPCNDCAVVASCSTIQILCLNKINDIHTKYMPSVDTDCKEGVYLNSVTLQPFCQQPSTQTSQTTGIRGLAITRKCVDKIQQNIETLFIHSERRFSLIIRLEGSRESVNCYTSLKKAVADFPLSLLMKAVLSQETLSEELFIFLIKNATKNDVPMKLKLTIAYEDDQKRCVQKEIFSSRTIEPLDHCDVPPMTVSACTTTPAGTTSDTLSGAARQCELVNFLINNSTKSNVPMKLKLTIAYEKNDQERCALVKISSNGTIESLKVKCDVPACTTTPAGTSSDTLSGGSPRCDESGITRSHVTLAAILSFFGGMIAGSLILLLVIWIRRKTDVFNCLCKKHEENSKLEGVSNPVAMATPAGTDYASSDKKLYSQLRQGQGDTEHVYDQSKSSYETLQGVSAGMRKDDHVYDASESAYQSLRGGTNQSNGRMSDEHVYRGLTETPSGRLKTDARTRPPVGQNLTTPQEGLFENRQSTTSEHKYFTLQNENFRMSETQEGSARTTDGEEDDQREYFKLEKEARDCAQNKANTEEDDPDHAYFVLQRSSGQERTNDQGATENKKSQEP